jgi:hypothetical protein
MIAACLRSTHVSTVPKQEQHGDRVADEDGGDDEVLDHAARLGFRGGDRANSASASIDRRRLRKQAENALTTPSKFV